MIGLLFKWTSVKLPLLKLTEFKQDVWEHKYNTLTAHASSVQGQCGCPRLFSLNFQAIKRANFSSQSLYMTSSPRWCWVMNTVKDLVCFDCLFPLVDASSSAGDTPPASKISVSTRSTVKDPSRWAICRGLPPERPCSKARSSCPASLSPLLAPAIWEEKARCVPDSCIGIYTNESQSSQCTWASTLSAYTSVTKLEIASASNSQI